MSRMANPSADRALSDDLIEQALAVVQADRLPYLATVEGDQPRLRPIAPARTDGFTVYIANLRTYGKTSEIEANPRVELCYLDGHHDQVRITGTAEVITDPKLKQEIWDSSPYIHKYIGEVENPDFILYRVVPTRVRFMKEWALTYREVPFQRSLKSTERP
jgi:general stress protein 26